MGTVTDVVSSINLRNNRSLYVGDLNLTVTEASINAKFNMIGPLLSIRICRDPATGRSLGYAYVNFQRPDHAQKALDDLSYEPLEGRPMRIMWSERDATLRISGIGNIYIKNLCPTIDSKTLRAIFAPYGRIRSSKLATDECGNSKGYGYVHFETEESATNAIAAVNGKFIGQKTLSVSRFIPRQARMGPRRAPSECNLYVKKFPLTWDDENFRKLFEPFGRILSSKIMVDPQEGRSLGFGFVAFEDPVAASNCIAEMNGKEIEGKLLYVGRAMTRQERAAVVRSRAIDTIRYNHSASALAPPPGPGHLMYGPPLALPGHFVHAPPPPPPGPGIPLGFSFGGFYR